MFIVIKFLSEGPLKNGFGRSVTRLKRFKYQIPFKEATAEGSILSKCRSLTCASYTACGKKFEIKWHSIAKETAMEEVLRRSTEVS